MIPKKIHYCWFGKNEIPENLKKCMDTWKKYAPDYEIIKWDEENYNVNKIKYMQEAYKNKKYAFVSDYARLDIIYSEGGFYFDLDVEILKSIDNLRKLDAFLACELKGEVATGLGFGAMKGNKFLLENMKVYENLDFLTSNKTCVEITTNLLEKKGLKAVNEIQEIDNIKIFPPSYFNPKSLITSKVNITDNTYTIHHYEASWNKSRKIYMSIKIIIRLFLDKIFGKGFYRNLLIKLKLKK